MSSKKVDKSDKPKRTYVKRDKEEKVPLTARITKEANRCLLELIQMRDQCGQGVVISEALRLLHMTLHAQRAMQAHANTLQTLNKEADALTATFSPVAPGLHQGPRSVG